LKADACVVDLHKFGLFFYEFGTYLSQLEHRDSAAIGSVLVQVSLQSCYRTVHDCPLSVLDYRHSLTCYMQVLQIGDRWAS
jgi:hypothetical protein